MADPSNTEGSPQWAAKAAVIDAFERSGLSKSELGRRLGVKESEVRRILDPRYPTKIGRLNDTAKVLGGRLDIFFIPGANDEFHEARDKA